VTATADQAVPSPRRYITRLVPPEALKLRRLNGRNPSEIASSSEGFPLPEAPAISAPPRQWPTARRCRRAPAFLAL
jgi:hypothetical protein